MQITAYQILNVLRTYEHLLKLKSTLSAHKDEMGEVYERSDRVTLSPESIERFKAEFRREQEDSV